MTVTQHDRIVDYYAKSWYDYRGVWMNKRNRAMHYGYWDEETTNHGDSLLNMNRELAAHAAITPGSRILDAGCGVGGSSMWLAEEFDAEVVGITLSPFQQRKAQVYATERGLSTQVKFQVADYCDTGFEPESFDIVWAQESVCYAQRKGDFLREAHRLLRPGGRIAIEDGFRASRNLPPSGEALLHDWADAWALPDLDTLTEFESAAADAGFTDFRARDVSSQIVWSARRLHRAALVFEKPSWVAAKLGWRSPEAHRNLVGAKLQWLFFLQRFGSIALVSAQKA